MKIAFLLSHFPQISETFILNRITGLLNRGHEVDIYAYGPWASDAMHLDIEKYRLLDRTHYFNMPENRIERALKGVVRFTQHFAENPAVMLRSVNALRYGREALSLRLVYGAVPFLKRRNYDIIHSHHGPNGLRDTWLKEIGALTGRHVTSFHGADATRHVQLYGPHVYDRLFMKGDYFLPVSEGMKKSLIDLGCYEQKIRVHHSGIDLKKFGFDNKMHNTNGKLRIVSVGRLVEKKGIMYGIRAFAQMYRKRRDLEYVIVGGGEMQPRLLQVAMEAGVSDNVKFLGDKSQEVLGDILSRSSLMLVPSVTASDGNREGIPNVIKEAFAAGVPVVATHHGEIPEIIEDENTGFLVPERDAEALAAKALGALEHRENTSRICEKARKFVEDEFDIEKLNDRLVNIYEGLLN